MHLRVHILLWVVVLWTLALIFHLSTESSAQTRRRKSAPPPMTAPPPATTPSESSPYMLRQNSPPGWVWVTQTIDLTQQLGGEENIMTLDGEPLPLNVTQRKRVTLGLIIDDEGHIVTRLIDVTPTKLSADLTVRAWGFRPVPAKFVGMDTVTGLCVLKASDPNLKPANFPTSNQLPARMNIRLYGFHPNQTLNLGSAIIAASPRTNFFNGLIAKAIDDFRYTAGNPIYYLLSPQLTPVQDCSLIMDKNDTVFGLAIYDTGSQGPHLVYPLSVVMKTAQAVIKSNQSIAHGWLGATGLDAAVTIPTINSKPSNEDLGVRITAVHPDGPADIAGVKAKDILLKINDRAVQTYAQLAAIIKRMPADSEVTLKIKRGSDYKLLKAKLAPAPATEPEMQMFAFARQLESMEEELKTMEPSNPNRQKLASRVEMMRVFVGFVTSPAPPEIRLRVFYGFEVQPLSGQLMNYFAVTNGILVSSVIENYKAARSGLSAGDVILKVGETQVNNLASLINALDKSSSDMIEITVSRRREQLIINFQR